MYHLGKGRSAGGHTGTCRQETYTVFTRAWTNNLSVSSDAMIQLSMSLLSAQQNKIYSGWPTPQAQLPPRRPQLTQPWPASLTGPCAHWLQLELSRSRQLAGLQPSEKRDSSSLSTKGKHVWHPGFLKSAAIAWHSYVAWHLMQV